MKTQIIENAFLLDEIHQLINHFNNAPITITEPNGNRNKSLDYHLPDSIVYKIIKPKLDKLVGATHEFGSGAYKECVAPYGTHVDTTDAQKQLSVVIFDDSNKHNVAVAIPLIEGDFFKTVTFDYFPEKNPGMSKPLLDEALMSTPNNLNLEDFDHIPEPTLSQVKYLPVDAVFNWKLGSMIMWDRRQLHTSTNFAKFNQTKKFIVIFVA
jgi:hypothetical protein